MCVGGGACYWEINAKKLCVIGWYLLRNHCLLLSLFFIVGGTVEDKMRMFIIYYMMTAEMSEVGVAAVCGGCGYFIRSTD